MMMRRSRRLLPRAHATHLLGTETRVADASRSLGVTSSRLESELWEARSAQTFQRLPTYPVVLGPSGVQAQGRRANGGERESAMCSTSLQEGGRVNIRPKRQPQLASSFDQWSALRWFRNEGRIGQVRSKSRQVERIRGDFGRIWADHFRIWTTWAKLAQI